MNQRGSDFDFCRYETLIYRRSQDNPFDRGTLVCRTHHENIVVIKRGTKIPKRSAPDLKLIRPNRICTRTLSLRRKGEKHCNHQEMGTSHITNHTTDLWKKVYFADNLARPNWPVVLVSGGWIPRCRVLRRWEGQAFGGLLGAVSCRRSGTARSVCPTSLPRTCARRKLPLQ